MAPKGARVADVVLPIDLENAYGIAFLSFHELGSGQGCMPTACSDLRSPMGACDTRFWQRCDDGWTVDRTTGGGWQGSLAVQVMFVLGLEFALSKSDDLAPREIKRIGLQDDMTFIGSAAALNRSWRTIEGALADAGHRLRLVLSSMRTQNCRSRMATELPQNAQWRMATALRLGATPDAGPRSTCALRKGKEGDM